jgi:peptidoglycan/xylan/chitin deacetylase (PgdA/CDA1 family)
MRIGTHGMHHVDWSKLDDARLHIETVDARHRLEDICGCEIGEASIPFGRYDRRVLAKLKAEGYNHVYTSGRGFTTPEAWLKPRNTLDRSWQRRDILSDLSIRDSYLSRLRSGLAQTYKSFW